MSFLKSATVLSATFLLATAAQAQCSGELLIANDHGAADYFGYSMAAEGNRLVIGAYGDDVGAVSNAGSVYVFAPWIGGYGQYQKITAGAGAANANFGKAVDLDSNQLAIGSPGTTVSGQGAAGEVRIYTLQGSSFVFSASIPNPDPAAAEGFGEDVAIWQDQLMIGCPGSDEGGTDRGAVYFYKRINGTWTLMNKIITPSNQTGLRGGAIIDMWGDAAVVGLPTHDSPGFTDDGAIVVYKRLADGHWTQDFFGIDAEYDGDRRGASVAVGEHVLLAGAPGRGYIEPGVGMVHVWYNQDETGTKVQWTPYFIQNYISATDFTAGNGFGNSMSISGNRVIIGSTAGTVRAAEFEINPLTRERTVVRNFRAVAGGSAQYGSSVALVGGLAAIGDPGLLYQGEVSMGGVRLYDPSQMGGSDHPTYLAPHIGIGTYHGCTEFATKELPASNRCGQSDNSPDVYYRLDLTSTGTFIVDTEGSSYDTVLGVTIDDSWNWICDDDSGSGQMSRIQFDNVGTTERLIRVSGYNGAAGAFVLNISATCGSSDFNHDGDYGTDSDIEAFFACLGGNCCSTCGDSDFNADGDFGTDADIEAFFRVLAGGVC